MEPKTLVLQYLDEAHALEAALATNLRAHMTMTPDGSYRSLLQKHLKETQDQVAAIERRRGELGENGGRGIVAAGAGLVRDVIGQVLVLTKGPLDAVRTMNTNERMLKNAKDECATEALEIATYDALEAAARAAGDATTARLAADHRATEERMLSDLRAEIPRLAVQTVEDRTDGAAVASTASAGATSSPRKRATSSRSKSSGTKAKSTGTSSRSRKSSGTSKSSSTSKANGSSKATKSTGSSSRSSSGRATSGGSKSGSSASRSKASSAKGSSSTGSSSKSSTATRSS